MYVDSLIAFLDVLGLSDRVRETECDKSKAQKIAAMLTEIQKIIEVINGRANVNWKTKFTAQGFSDSILISCPIISDKTFYFMANIVATFQFTTMRHQFFLRGGISAGGHYEKGAVAFGPAFVRAYEMEKMAIWPRVLIDPIVLKKLSSETVMKVLNSYVSRAGSGLCYINYLHLLVVQQPSLLEKEHLTEEEITHLDFAETFRNHKKYLLATVGELKANAGLALLSKYHAVAHYHNRYIKEVYESLPIDENYKTVDPTTVTGQIVDGIKTLASSREGIEPEDIAVLDLYIKTLYRARQQIKECEIDPGAVFGPLYPHLGQD